MTHQEVFLKDFEEWIETQIKVNESAMQASQDIWQAEGDPFAKEAYIRYESRLDAYQFIQGKFANYHAGRAFHDLPDDLFGKRHY